MKTLMEEDKIKKFYDTYRWFAQLFNDIHGLLTLISNRYEVKVPKLYYQTVFVGPPLLPDPYYCAFKLKEKPEWKVCLVSVCCPDDVLKNEKLKEKITEPAVIVIMNNLKDKKVDAFGAYHILNNSNINKFNVNNDTSFSGFYSDKYNGGGEFKGFFVPLYSFSKQALEQKSKKENITLEQALNNTIDELIVKRLESLLQE